jgi:hypothetical protein
MSFISKCLQGKVNAGLLDVAQVKHIEDTLAKVGPGQAETELASALHDEIASNLDHSVRSAFNHLNNMAEIDKIADAGSISLARERFLERPAMAADAHVGIMSQYIGRIVDDWRPTIFKNPNATRANELEILNSLHGLPGQSGKSVAAADSIRKLNQHRIQILKDAGVKLPDGDIRADRARPAVLPQNIVRLGSEELGRLVTAAVDREAFNNIMQPALKAFGSEAAMFDGVRKAYASGFVEGLPIRPQLLKEMFATALVPKSPESFFQLTDALGSKSLVGDLLMSIQQDGKRAARSSLLGDSPRQANQLVNRLMSKLEQSGKYSADELQNLRNNVSSSIKYGFGELDRYNLDNAAFKIVEAGFADAKNIASGVFIPGVSPANWFSDVAVREAAQRQYGLGSASISDLLANLVQNRKNKNAMMEAGVLGNIMVEEALERYRVGTTLFGNNFSSQFAAKAIRMSGLLLETNAQRVTATKLALSKLNTMLHEVSDFNQLDVGIKKLLQRASIFNEDWDKLRAASNRGDHSILDIVKLVESDDVNVRRLAVKVDEALLHFMNVAVPTKSAGLAKVRAQMHSVGPAAGMGFEALSTFMSYPAVFWKEHVMKPLEVGTSYGLKYAAATMAMATVGMYAGFQARNAMNGKVPTATDADAWQYAALSSAGLGGAVMQELLGTNYAGTSSLAGAVGAVPLGATKAVLNNIQKAARGEETNFAWDGIKATWDAVPRNAGVRLLLERMIFDNMQKMFDPHARTNIQRKIAKQKKKGGYWWEPGAEKPSLLD